MKLNKKLFENMQVAKTILAKHNIDVKDEEFQKLKNLLEKNNNLGFIGKFTKWLIEDREEFSYLESVYKELKRIGGIDKPIESFEKLEDLYDYIQIFETKRKVNQVIKALPSGVRQYADDKLLKLIELNIDKANIIVDHYSKKGGRYKSSKQLYDITKALIENAKGGWNVQVIKDKIAKVNAKSKNPGAEIVAEGDSLLFVVVYSYEASCELGAKAWCIVTSKGSFDSYVDEFKQQFFVYDFDKPISDKHHMMGVTLYHEQTGVKTAHWADDTKVDNVEKVLHEFEQRMDEEQKMNESSTSRLVPESLDFILEESDVETKPDVKPTTKPGIAPSRPSPIPSKKPSVMPRPKAQEKDVVKRFMELKKLKKKDA